ncbi:hypothetical protein [Paractinoplanes rishiriensis]|uniref:Uncharacterized protein n=1 Tax=Paractinoplanes rishiriensis TaxID=1050105 RepID=A0A919KBF4_9ACTN|nr:hypothetical protein [Actinoplanes rishiriensis]GIF00227.1 hypothetical protein Ari01nite_76910 [Actinoplanes rishiriensis]
MAHAEHFMREMAIAGWTAGRRGEYVVVDTGDGVRLDRVEFGLKGNRTAEIGYWMDPVARGSGSCTGACGWTRGRRAAQAGAADTPGLVRIVADDSRR